MTATIGAVNGGEALTMTEEAFRRTREASVDPARIGAHVKFVSDDLLEGRYPGLRGGEKSTPVAEALAERGVPFVFATGGDGDSVDPRFRDRPRLQKPFTMDGVAKALASL